MQYPLHPKWEGVWEIRGNSRWNGERMIIIISSSSQECILTDPKSLEDFTLTAEPQNNLKAHWDFRSNGKSQQRYYIGTLLKQKNFKEIEWSEMRKNRKTDKWIRIEGISPSQYLEKAKQKLSNQHKRRHYNSQNNKRIIRKSNNKHNMNEDDQYYHRHPSILQKSRHHQQYSSTSPNLQYQQKSSPKYVPKIKSKMNNNNNDNSQSQINDPAIMNMGNASSSFSHSMTELDRSRDRDNPYRDPFKGGGSGSSRDRDRDRPKYQTQHRPTARNQYYAEYYPKPRRTKLRHAQIHEPRHTADKKKFAMRNKGQYYQVKGNDNNGNKAAVIDGYLNDERSRYNDRRDRDRNRGDRDRDNTRNRDRRDRKDRKDRDRDRKERRQKKKARDRFNHHITKDECDKVLAETNDFKNPVLYVGEISISRFNPNVCYVSVPTSDRDIRISGFVDRNRAFHGDKVIVTIYPECEWMAAIKPEITAFQNLLDERDRNKIKAIKAATPSQEELMAMEEPPEEDDEDLNEVIYDELKKKEQGDPGASSSATSEEDEEVNDGNNVITETDTNENKDKDKNDDEEEIIYFEDSDSEKDKAKETETQKKQDDDVKNAENADIQQLENKMETVKLGISEKKEDEKEQKQDGRETKTDKALFKKARRRFEELNDENSITAYDQYLFLKDNAEDFKKFQQKWPDLKLTDENHPRRDYIDKVIKKCGGKLPSEALDDFAWNNPSDHSDKIPRGKIIGIYEQNKRSRESVPGFVQPLIYNAYGEIDRKWAVFTPDDKRYPKAHFPMRELPKSLKELFRKFEKEEIDIVEEYENRKYDLQKQGYKYKQIDSMIKKRVNRYNEELKLMFFNMEFENKWPDHFFMPVCHLKKEIGKRGAVEVETKVILSRHSINWTQKFSKEVENYVKDFKIDPEKDYKGRRDCRDMRVFTIDPTSARDFDDALSIEELKDEFDDQGNKLYRIGIHIADVTHFVKEGTPVDKEAKHRATSVYLVDRCLPMLPHHLCQNLCSLNPDVDRLAYSVFVILNEKGHLVNRKGDGKDPYSKSPWFGKTVIRSRARLNYETAHWMLIDKVTKDTPLTELDDCCKISDDTSLEDIISDTKLFWVIAKQMRERRFNAGSVQFFRPHIRFRLDKKDKHKALVFGPEILLWSNNLIEEMMLLANQLVANQLINKVKEHTLLRKHPSPLQERGQKLQLICRSQDMDLKFDTPKHLNESLIEMQKKTYGGINAAQVINALLAQAMMRAEYIIVEDLPETEWSHWALNFPIYTHFTSPIRRYADVIVHRLLSYTISSDREEQKQKEEEEKVAQTNNDNNDDEDVDLIPDPYSNTNKDPHNERLPSIYEMKKQCEVCNDRNASAHFAEIDSQTIHLCLVLIDHPIIVDTMLIDLYNAYFILVVPGLGLDVRVNVQDCIRESKGAIESIHKEYELPDSVLIVKWRNGDIEEYKLFDKMRIRLSSILRTPIKLVTSIIEPSKRKYLKAANADAIKIDNANNDFNDDKQEKNNDNNDEEEQGEANDNEYNEEDVPVAMTLDQQLKVGTCDFYAAHYD